MLARDLAGYSEKNPLVVAIPHGGVPVGAAVAKALGAELDILVVHKLGVPGHPYIAAGALASSGAANVNHRAIGSFGISPIALEQGLEKERLALEQHELELRGGRPASSVVGRTVIVVDDGIATGATLRTAVSALRARGASQVIVAVPVAPAPALEALRHEADQVVCPMVAAPFFTIAQSYEDFSLVSASFIKRLLDEHAAQRPSGQLSASTSSRDVPIRVGEVRIAGTLTVPDQARGLVVFLHGSGSNRFSPRNAFVARALERAGFATLLVDLLTAEEQAVDNETQELRKDVSLAAARAVGILDWLEHEPTLAALPIGLFGASSGAAAALIAASQRPKRVLGIVSRGGRPDLAEQALPEVSAPVLMLVGADDHAVLELNRAAALRLNATHRLEIVSGAGHLFEGPGSIEQAAELAARFFRERLQRS
ncbi:MAG TPA: phosphoribosyltransferase family protein [Polyangiaceae bacterium]|nr:phosphoribosyltransferase family protein [Polyangiaceae bacterium]